MRKTWCLFALALLPCLAAAAPARAEDPDGEAIKAYIKAHPEVVMEALAQQKELLYDLVLQGRRVRQRRLWRADIKKGLANPLKPEVDPKRPRWGDPKAPMLIVEYTDFLCPACREGSFILERLMAKHPKRYQVVLKHRPSDDLSRQVALYYEAIARQDPEKARKFYDQMFLRQNDLAKNGLKVALEEVKALKLDQTRLARDLADPALAERLKQDDAEAKALHLGGTPAFVMAGVAIRGAAPLVIFEDVYNMSQGKEPGSLDH